jgi:hypothetical protein
VESFIEISLHTLSGFQVGSVGKTGVIAHKLEESCLLIRPKGRGTISGVLLNHVTGATSFEDLRTINSIIFPMFREAAEKRGLIEVVRLPKRGVLLRLITLSMSELVRPNVSRCHFHFEGYLPLF